MTFRVELSEAALADAKELYERVIVAAPFRGPLWYSRLLAAIESLQTFPQRCAFAPENNRFPIEVRQLLFGRKPNVYRVIFTVEVNRVYVFRIRSPRQQGLEDTDYEHPDAR